jgi:D-aminoacyl-tRNA deacylase
VPSIILIVASNNDEAGRNIARKIIELYDFKILPEQFQGNPIYERHVGDVEARLLFIDEDSIHAQFIQDCFEVELIIFVSRHSSSSGIPTLSVHTPGNLTDEAKFGGIPERVSVSPASMMKDTLQHMAKMKEEIGLNYKVSYECTHHGPSLDIPTMFAELGSSPKQWRDLKAAEAVARAVVCAIQKSSTYPAAIGVGGPHYNEKLTRIALNTTTAFGHIIPKYAAHFVDASVVRQCVKRTKEKVKSAVIDWKGIRAADRNRIATNLRDMGLNVERV